MCYNLFEFGDVKLNEKETNFYDSIKKNISLSEIDKPIINDMTSIAVLHDSDFMPVVQMGLIENLKNNVIYYISDLHLDYKILNHFKNRVSNEKVVDYINAIADKISEQFCQSFLLYSYLLIAGDISFNFELSRIFFERLVSNKKIGKRSRIIVVLGNHEYWEEKNVSATNDKYKELFDKLGITFLHNELLYVDKLNFNKLTEDEINNSIKGEIAEKCLNSNLMILGGTGFSGLNPKYNASKGLYKNAIKTIEDDKIESLKMEKVYKKLKEELGNREMIVLSHMPKPDWSNDNYNSMWIYVSGHTHNNEYYKDSSHTIYADNQIGYYNDNINLKYFVCNRKYNIFNNYSDGIYEISRDEYIRFNYGMGIRMSYNRTDGKIFLLKNSGVYLFLRQKNSSLYLLEGGKIKKLKVLDLNYYYNNMPYYSQKIKEGTSKYNNFMKKLSEYVKSFGGYGTIHGCIVDIDFLNHIYVNIFDGTIRPYYALSTTYKIPYDSLEELLESKCPKLYLNYKKALTSKSNLIRMNNKDSSLKSEVYENTDIYKISNYMRSLQYLVEDNVIRAWDENLISKKHNILE